MPADDKKADDDKSKQADKAAGGDDKKTAVDVLTPEQQRQVLGYLVQQNQTLHRELVGLKEQLNKKPEPGDKKPAPKKDAPDDDAVDIELLSRAQFKEHMLKDVEKRVLEPILERLGKNESTIEAKYARDELEKLAGKHPELWDFSDELKNTLNKYPDLSMEEAYILAKHAAPEKVKKLDDTAKAKENEKSTDQAKKEKARFGGLFPTSGKTAPSKRLNPKDAAEAAWESTGAGEHLAALGE